MPNVMRHTRKANRTNSTFGFCRHAKPTLKKTKRAVFSLRLTRKTKNIFIFANNQQVYFKQVNAMATFGEFIKKEREKKEMNQSDFGQNIGIIMTDISKIENGRKKFPFANLDKLANFIEQDIEDLKTLFVADILVEEVNKYECSDRVFSVAEEQSKYLKSKNAKQGNFNF